MLKCTLNTPGWLAPASRLLTRRLLTGSISPVTMDEPHRGRHASAERDGVHPQAEACAGSKFTTPAHPARPNPNATQSRPQDGYRGHDHAAHR